jgi:hypothetical protein
MPLSAAAPRLSRHLAVLIPSLLEWASLRGPDALLDSFLPPFSRTLLAVGGLVPRLTQTQSPVLSMAWH